MMKMLVTFFVLITLLLVACGGQEAAPTEEPAAPGGGGKVSDREQAAQWLQEFLASGPASSAGFFQAGKYVRYCLAMVSKKFDNMAAIL